MTEVTTNAIDDAPASRSAVAAFVLATLAMVSTLLSFLGVLSVLTEVTSFVYGYAWATALFVIAALIFGRHALRVSRAGDPGVGLTKAALTIAVTAALLMALVLWVGEKQAKPVGNGSYITRAMTIPQPNGVTQDKYDQIKFDMPYDKVASIFGSPGTLNHRSHSIVTGTDTQYVWPLKDTKGYVELGFRQDKLKNIGSSGIARSHLR